MECACITVVRSCVWVGPKPEVSFRRTSRASLRLTLPYLVSHHRDPKASCLEKKMEKGRRHIQKYFIAARVSMRKGKNSDVRLTFSALQVRRWSNESLHRSSLRSHEVTNLSYRRMCLRYFNTRNKLSKWMKSSFKNDV